MQLIIGRNAGAGVTFERSKAGGIVVGGAIDPPLRAEYVPETAEVQVGERVTTSGQDGIYPQGFLVGHRRARDADRAAPIGKSRFVPPWISRTSTWCSSCSRAQPRPEPAKP